MSIKQLITAAIFSLIKAILETIHCTGVILDFTMLVQYLSYNNETLFYIKYALYKLDKTKIAFENHNLIDANLFRQTFKYLKFNAIIYFVKYI